MSEFAVRIDGAKFYAEGPDSTDDNITVVANRANGLRIVIEEPWAGDTETGFGKECSISLDAVAARKLRDFLNEWLADQEGVDHG